MKANLSSLIFSFGVKFFHARRLALCHLIISVFMAIGIIALVKIFWFPAPYHSLAGGMQLVWWILGVDVVCGPLLTWILLRPEKSRLALGVDVLLIACLQLGALAYGLHALAQSKPLALVFEVDRFRVISYADVPEEELNKETLPAWFTPWHFKPPQVQGLRSVTSFDEKIASVESALQGVDAAQYPSRWQAYESSRADILKRARALDELIKRYPIDAIQINDAARSTCGTNCLWLPVVGRRSAEWVALIDPNSAQIVNYLPLDGFF